MGILILCLITIKLAKCSTIFSPHNFGGSSFTPIIFPTNRADTNGVQKLRNPLLESSLTKLSNPLEAIWPQKGGDEGVQKLKNPLETFSMPGKRPDLPSYVTAVKEKILFYGDETEEDQIEEWPRKKAEHKPSFVFPAASATNRRASVTEEKAYMLVKRKNPGTKFYEDIASPISFTQLKAFPAMHEGRRKPEPEALKTVLRDEVKIRDKPRHFLPAGQTGPNSLLLLLPQKRQNIHHFNAAAEEEQHQSSTTHNSSLSDPESPINTTSRPPLLGNANQKSSQLQHHQLIKLSRLIFKKGQQINGTFFASPSILDSVHSGQIENKAILSRLLKAIEAGADIHQEDFFQAHLLLVQLQKALEAVEAAEAASRSGLRPLLKKTMTANLSVIKWLFTQIMRTERLPEKKDHILALRPVLRSHLQLLIDIFSFS